METISLGVTPANIYFPADTVPAARLTTKQRLSRSSRHENHYNVRIQGRALTFSMWQNPGTCRKDGVNYSSAVLAALVVETTAKRYLWGYLLS